MNPYKKLYPPAHLTNFLQFKTKEKLDDLSKQSSYFHHPKKVFDF